MSQPQVWTISTILQWTTRYFQEKQIASARLDAELLLGHACGYSRLDLYLKADQPLADEEKDIFRSLVRRRVEGVPVAYLIGQKDFWTLTLRAHEGVLIPRPDTEILVETLCSHIQAWRQSHSSSSLRIAELGTGTGAIPLALCAEAENLEIVSVDINPLAIKNAAENLRHHPHLLGPKNNRVHLIGGDRFEMLAPARPFDLILSNPPYIPTPVIPTLQKEIVMHEPHNALDGGKDGLDFYRYFLTSASQWLKPSGSLFCEMGSDQLDALKVLIASHADWTLEQVTYDLQNHPRVLHIKMRQPFLATNDFQ